MFKTLLFAQLLAVICVAPALGARKWTDATGQYTVEGDMIGATETVVVIQKTDKKKDLVAIRINQLSKADQEYVKSREAADATQRAADGEQKWTMRTGLEVNARVVDYGRRDVTLQRRRSKIYVNDRLFDNLSGVQQKIVLRIVSHFEKMPIETRQDLEKWIIRLRADPKTFTVDGVVLELENGDEYGVPFFLFSEKDLKVLEPGWQQWLAVHQQQVKAEQAQAEKEQHAMMLQAQAQAYQRDREEERRLRMLELDLLAATAGVTSIWEVELFPRGGGYPRMVVVPGRNSEAAAQAALAKFPGSTVGGIARIGGR
jgi:hypothetical protein